MTKPAPCDLALPIQECRPAETPASPPSEEIPAELLPAAEPQVAAVEELSPRNLAGSLQIRNRIKEFRWVRAGDLIRHPKNWRRHPKVQVAAFLGLLKEIGYAGALLVRQLPDGRWIIIDGHTRATIEPDAIVPVLVLDLTEEEAEKLLLTYDPLAAMAEADAERIRELVEAVRTDDQAVEDLIRRTAGERIWGELYPQIIQEAEVPLDRARALREKWGTALGQRWGA